MNHKCKQFASEEISLFVDNELMPEKHQALAHHLTLCTACRALADEYTQVSSLVSHHVGQKIGSVDTDRIKTHLHQTMQTSSTSVRPFGNLFGFSGKHLYLKVASLALVLIVSFFGFHNTLFNQNGPSAIVKSVDTDFASVMIIETQKEKHTIIWFSET